MSKKEKEFNNLYDKFVEKIFRFIFLKVNSKEIAEDLTSETFLKVFEFLKNNNNPKIKNPSAFLYQIARNLVIDYYREKGKINFISLDSGIPIEDQKENLKEKIEKEIDFEILKKAICELNDDYQNAIIWYYIEQMPIEQIANLLGKSEGATRVLISRAIKVLREKINEKL